MILDIVESSEDKRIQCLNRRLGESPEVLDFVGEGAHPKKAWWTALQGETEQVQPSVRFSPAASAAFMWAVINGIFINGIFPAISINKGCHSHQRLQPSNVSR